MPLAGWRCSQVPARPDDTVQWFIPFRDQTARRHVVKVMRADRPRRYTILFYSLLFTLAAGPVMTVLGFGGGLIEFFLVANLLMAVIPLATGRPRRLLVGGLLLIVAARLATAWLDHPVLSAIALATWTVVALVAAGSALRFAMQSRTVAAEHLYAALSAYLLAGIFLGLFYWVLEQLQPSTFVTASGEFSRTSAIYFSFVTLATLGYGDIVPRSDLARGLAVVEGIGGQLFLAVLVARMVSSYVRGKDDAD